MSLQRDLEKEKCNKLAKHPGTQSNTVNAVGGDSSPFLLPGAVPVSEAASKENSTSAATSPTWSLREGYEEPPEHFICPITQTVMRQPVKDCHGHTFEAIAIVRWLSFKHCCPINRRLLWPDQLHPNTALQQEIEEWQAAGAALESEAVHAHGPHVPQNGDKEPSCSSLAWPDPHRATGPERIGPPARAQAVEERSPQEHPNVIRSSVEDSLSRAPPRPPHTPNAAGPCGAGSSARY